MINESEIVNDLQRLIKLGYEESLCVAALKSSHGNYDLALRTVQQMTLKNGCVDTSWTKEESDDWVRNITNNSLSAQNRALSKSPIYIRVASWRRVYSSDDKYRIFYKLVVTLKDNRRWSVEKPFTEFVLLYNKLPFGACNGFKTQFPLASSLVASIFTLSETQIEERRSFLENWLIEISLSEKCMTDEYILNLMYSFIQADMHGGRAGAAGTSASISTDTGSVNGSLSPPASALCSPLLSSTQVPNPLNFHYQILLPNNNLTSLPVTVPQLSKLLPCKINYNAPICIVSPDGKGAQTTLATLTGVEEQLNGISKKDISIEQLRKDYSRDRIIIQGKRLLGSKGGYEQVLDCCVGVVTAMVNQTQISIPATRTNPAIEKSQYCMNSEDILNFCKVILTHSGRTESAFQSHAAISNIVSLMPPVDDVDGKNDDAVMPLLIVPESELAKPIEINFQLKRKSTPSTPKTTASANSVNVADWCIICDIQAATVFKFCDAESMEATLQLKTTYYHQIMEFPRVGSDAGKRKSNTQLLLEKDTTTTRRDLQ